MKLKKKPSERDKERGKFFPKLSAHGKQESIRRNPASAARKKLVERSLNGVRRRYPGRTISANANKYRGRLYHIYCTPSSYLSLYIPHSHVLYF